MSLYAAFFSFSSFDANVYQGFFLPLLTVYVVVFHVFVGNNTVQLS